MSEIKIRAILHDMRNIIASIEGLAGMSRDSELRDRLSPFLRELLLKQDDLGACFEKKVVVRQLMKVSDLVGLIKEELGRHLQVILTVGGGFSSSEFFV